MADRIGLDVGHDEVLVQFPGDDVEYHARLLLVRIRGSLWMASSPDLEVQPLDLSQVYHYVCVLGQPYPEFAVNQGL